MKRNIIWIVAISVLSGTSCSSLPNLKVGYYLPKSHLEITVTQTAACTDGSVPVVVTDASLSPSYSSDREKFKTIEISDIDGKLSKGDSTFTFYDDGRLKSINTKQTGQGVNAIKTFLSVASMGGIKRDGVQVKSSCDFLNKITNDQKKGFTIIHRGYTNFEQRDTGVKIELIQSSVEKEIFRKLAPIFGSVSATYSIEESQPSHKPGKNSGPTITVVEPALARIKVNAIRGQISNTVEGVVWAPQHGIPIELPIQKAPLFGENEFEIELSGAGKVKKLRYSGDSGASGLLSASTELESAFKSETVEEQVNRIRSDADLIYQQQRLIQCQTDPATCAID